MKFGWAVPSIAAIQRTNVFLVAATAAILAWLDSMEAAVGCLLGGAIVIANLWLLAALGRLVLAAAGAGVSGAAAKLGMAAIPLKLLIVVALVYLVFTRAHVDAMGFGLGVLTQLLAITIETGRASIRSAA
jgi:hypothetical protein